MNIKRSRSCLRAGAAVGAALFCTVSLGFAQERIFVGSSVGGSGDPWWLLDTELGTIDQSGGGNETNNVSGAAFHPLSGDLVVAAALAKRVNATALDSSLFSGLEFSTTTSGNAHGVQIDVNRKLIYNMSRISGSPFDLNILDGDPASPGYGDLLQSVSTLGGERFGVSPSGDWLAMAPSVVTGELYYMSLDPLDPDYLVSQATPTIPGLPALAFGFGAVISDDNRYAIYEVSASGSNLYPRLDLQTGTWVDVDTLTPGIQHVRVFGGIPVGIVPVRGSNAFLVATGGSVGRLDFGSTPESWTYTNFDDVSNLGDSISGLSVSLDRTRFAITSLEPARVLIGDAANGDFLSEILLPSSAENIYTTTWSGPETLGTLFCWPGNENSTGESVLLTGQETTVGSGLHLEAIDGPPLEFGYFLVGDNQAASPLVLSEGLLCLGFNQGAQLGRFNVNATSMDSIGRFDANGVLQNLVNTSAVGSGFDVPDTLPLPGQPILMQGQTWYYQLWYRDSDAGAGSSNLSNGLQFTF